MAHPPHPPPFQPPPPGYPPPYAARPSKPRPRKRWFVVGALLLVAAVAVFVVGLVTTLQGATRTDAVVDATATRVDVGVEADSERMLFVPQSLPAPTCTLTDAEGRELRLEPTGVSTTVTTEGRTWVGVGTFTSPTSQVSIGCDAQAAGTPVRIGPPLGGGFVGGLLVTILVPLLLGGAGLVLLVVTTVLYLTRPPRQAAPPA